MSTRIGSTWDQLHRRRSWLDGSARSARSAAAGPMPSRQAHLPKVSSHGRHGRRRLWRSKLLAQLINGPGHPHRLRAGSTTAGERSVKERRMTQLSRLIESGRFLGLVGRGATADGQTYRFTGSTPRLLSGFSTRPSNIRGPSTFPAGIRSHWSIGNSTISNRRPAISHVQQSAVVRSNTDMMETCRRFIRPGRDRRVR